MTVKIRSEKFNNSVLGKLEGEEYGSNWPVVYILENSVDAYVGETTSAKRRIQNHLDDPKRKKFKEVHIIEHPMFNKSATLDTESRLIEYLSADEKYILQNSNRGLRNHNYYNKDFYRKLFEEIWAELTKLEIVQNSIRNIENSDLFKYSPFKSLTDDQADIVDAIERKVRNQDVSVSVVNGEPGSGKTILAIYLVKYLLSDAEKPQLKVAIVLPQTSLRETVRKIFRHVSGLKPSMVLGPNDVANETEKFDVLIVDESHRLMQRRNLPNYGTFDAASEKLGLNPTESSQVDWILKQSNHTIFLYDGGQTVRPSDADKAIFDKINRTADKYTLLSQLRVLAGNKYSEYIDRIFRTVQQDWISFPGYDLRLYERLGDMVSDIKRLDEHLGLCRIVAGFAWEWISRDDKTKFDIQIQDQKLQWNATTQDWINSPNSVNEVGCIHTVQGYDLNYVGVIVGPEITYANGSIKFHPDKYKDRYGKHSSLTPSATIGYIVNIYKTLMTRGICGAFVFACDDELRKYLSRFIPRYVAESELLAAENPPTYKPDEWE